MDKNEIIRRLKLALEKYIENDAWTSAALALASGKTIKEIEFFYSDKTENFKELSQFRDELSNLIGGVKDDDLKSRLIEISRSIEDYIFKKTLTIFCGPSCTGKDTLLSELKIKFENQNVDIDFLDKYTTRSPRAGENEDPRKLEPSSNYSFIDNPMDFVSNKDIVQKYTLYGHKYGFSKEHLLGNFPNLACIYGDIRKIEKFRKSIENKYNRKTFSVLLNSDPISLENRLNRRHSLTAEEYRKRNEEMHRQIAFIQNNVAYIEDNFDLVIDNSNESAVNSVLNAVLENHFLYKTTIS